MATPNKLHLHTNLLLLLLFMPFHSTHAYNVGQVVPLFVNKIGPLQNPSETYRYYEFPFCHPEEVVEKKESIGEILNGDRLANALYKFEFAVNYTQSVLCQQKLNKDDIAKFRNAISNEFYFQMYCDDLPLWAFVGKVENEISTSNSNVTKHLLFTHVQFNVLYNKNQVIEINAFSDPSHVVDITENVETNVKFTYSVLWTETSTPYKNRMDRYLRASLLPILHKTHLFSFINSIVIIVLLMGLLTVLFLRHLKNDMKKWSIGDEEVDKEVGSRLIHGDVLRHPNNLPLLAAIIGSGTQLLVMVFILCILSFLGVIYPYSRGGLSVSIFVSYMLTSTIAGYTSSSLCSRYAEHKWETSVLLAGTLFLGPFIVTSFILNTLAAHFGVTAALPFGTIIIIFILYALFAIPLLMLGGVVGNGYRFEPQSASAIKISAREIRSLSWYRKLPAQMFLGGLLPFSVIIPELQYLMDTIWGYKIYTIPSILFVTFVILVVLTAMVSVCLTYFQLAVEEHDWWWRSVLRGGSSAIFTFGYCIHFYSKSNMSGLLQGFFYFGRSACMCYALFLILGTVSFQSSLLFVRRISHAVKSE